MKVQVLIYLILACLSLLSECKVADVETNQEEILSKKKTTGDTKKLLALKTHCSTAFTSTCKSSTEKKENNYISLLVCMENNLESLTGECQGAFFDYRFQLYSSPSLVETLESNCADDLTRHCAGKRGNELVTCATRLETDGKNLEDSCLSYIKQLGQVLFSDHQVLADIHEFCDSDMDSLGCKVGLGRLGMFGSPVERIVQCLMHNTGSLSDGCSQRFFAGEEGTKKDTKEAGVHEECKFDLKKLCSASDLNSEESSYKCLLSHLSQISSPSCQEAVLERQGFSFPSLGISPDFYQQCAGDLKKRRCSSSSVHQQGDNEGEFTKMTDLLLCLEKKGKEAVSSPCTAQVAILKEKFMGQYELSLEFARACEIDREEFCTVGPESIVDCLKRNLQASRDLDSQLCGKQLTLLSQDREAEAHLHNMPDDTGVDAHHIHQQPAKLHKQQQTETDYAKYDLSQFCHKELQEFCSVSHGEKQHKDSFFCLAQHLSEHSMSTVCREHVGHIQYFLPRPLPADSGLVQGCSSELSQMCNLEQGAGEENDKPPALACLFSHYKEGNDVSFSSKCQKEMDLFLHSAAKINEMDKELFTSCISAMGEFCSPPADHSSELDCLRQHQERIESDSHCFQMLEEYNGVEEGMPNNVHMQCHLAIKMFCLHVEPHELVKCLQDSSSNPSFDGECKAALKHVKHIVTDTDWKYDSHLNVNCKNDLLEQCPHASTRSDAIECLSKSAALSLKCKAYIENAVGEDPKEISKGEEEVPHVVQSGILTNTLESRLRAGCSKEIDFLCSTSHPDQFLDCLIDFKMDSHVSQMCHETIITEEIDYVVKKHMEGGVMEACDSDIKNYCPSESTTEKLFCLRSLVKAGGLRPECIREMEGLDGRIHGLQLDKNLAIKCHSNAFKLCHNSFPSSESLVTCLSQHMRQLESDHENKGCISEVVVLIGQAQLDIHKDPDLAEKCRNELKNGCDNVPTGHGERIKCLFYLQSQDSSKIGSSCSKALRDRTELWNNLSKKYPNIERGLEVILDSSLHILKKRVYPNIGRIFQTLFLLFLAVGIVVLCILCRATKRVRRKIM